MDRDIERILISRERIAARVRELAKLIVNDHQRTFGIATEITIVPILTGAMIFCGDLIREMPIAMRIGLLTVSSYPGRSVTSQGTQVMQQQLSNVKSRHVLLVDDILDSGNTLRAVVPALQELQPISLKTCVLLRKEHKVAQDVTADYVGFEIPDEFVVGYGLDFNDYYRNLPDIVTLKRVVLESES